MTSLSVSGQSKLALLVATNAFVHEAFWRLLEEAFPNTRRIYSYHQRHIASLHPSLRLTTPSGSSALNCKYISKGRTSCSSSEPVTCMQDNGNYDISGSIRQAPHLGSFGVGTNTSCTSAAELPTSQTLFAKQRVSISF